ncbi:glycosyltransferase family 2 protein [Cognatiluteimonas telluris]|jgi:hypothetical protein|uniref:glycosyltransferase family 2 protein n=1 Tax=Cognatiluteimonas telluris TaxID=1104775 RepID=UPI001407F3A9|nr:glycosyltransferase family 2 protein [Lysobacter telluris]
MTDPRILAFIAVRDEQHYLPRVLAHLATEGIETVVLDNESGPAARAQLEGLRDAGLVRSIVELPYVGHFDLLAQLQAKARLIETCQADWVMHLDADEMPHSPIEGETLAQAIARADDAGANAINFNEFVFLPLEDPAAEGRAQAGFFPFHHYYHFAPAPRWRMLAWRRDAALSNVDSGGHLLAGPGLQVWEHDMVLRHYVFLSQQHAFEKYARRRFAQAELAIGWHHNRINLAPRRMRFPPPARLHRLLRLDQRALDTSRPDKLHYWDWPEAAA